MENVINFLKDFNIQTIVPIVIIFWYFSRDIKSEMKLLEDKIDKQSDRIDRLHEMSSERTDKLYEMFIDLLKDKKS